MPPQNEIQQTLSQTRLTVFLQARRKPFWASCLVMGAILGILSQTGCSHSRFTPNLPLMKGKGVTSSQWEPDVDYESERQAEPGL